MVQFGSRLRELRLEKKLTQQQLSEMLGLSQSSIAYYEKSKKEPSLITLLQLAKFFNISLDYLVGLSSNRQNGHNGDKGHNEQQEPIEMDEAAWDIYQRFTRLSSEAKERLILEMEWLEQIEQQNNVSYVSSHMSSHVSEDVSEDVSSEDVSEDGSLSDSSIPSGSELLRGCPGGEEKEVSADSQETVFEEEPLFPDLVLREAELYYQQGLAFLKNREFEEAIEAFSRSINLNNQNAKAFYLRGGAFAALQRYQQCVADCTTALEIDPLCGQAYHNRGLAYLRLGKLEEALADCHRAVELLPQKAAVLVVRGYAYQEAGLNEQAIDDFRAALRIDPGCQAARQQIAILSGENK